MKLYNTLTRKVEVFEPRDSANIQLFVCGPTVYDYSHLGHAKTYTQMDTLVRFLRYSGNQVFYLQNITDIDDKIITRASEGGVGWQDLSRQYEDAYHQDMQSLGNTSVSQYARASGYIADIIRQVQTLIDTGHAYRIEDGIYFEIATFPDYGKLSGRQEIKKNDAQSRIDHSDEKRGWNDFCLWKFSKPGEPTWEAPFGVGRPGWHIEDTAITEHFFGPQYDLHGGAIDLIFPHHEAEITQMESASGEVPFVRYWTHVGFLNIDNAKMSKSLGNFHTIRGVIEDGHDPMAIRLLMLQSHYRSSVNFTWDLLEAATNRLMNWRAMATLRWQLPNAQAGFSFEPYLTKISQHMSEDLNTPEALAAVEQSIDGLEQAFTNRRPIGLQDFTDFLQALDDIFGLQLTQLADITTEQKQLIIDRETARSNKDWRQSDAIRDTLASQQIGLRDTSAGAVWFRL